MSQATAYPECRHILPSGAKCHSPALRGRAVCYFHARQRTLVNQNRYRFDSVGLPPLEDRGAIQIAINEVLAALAARKLTHHAAGVYLYGIQLASTNLELASRTPPPPPVTDLYRGDGGDLLAPPGPVPDPEIDPAADLAAHPLTDPAGSTADDTDHHYTYPEIELDGSPRSNEPQEEDNKDKKPWPVSTELPYINKHGTHEYDREPPRPKRKITPEQQKVFDVMEKNMVRYYEARDRRRELAQAAEELAKASPAADAEEGKS